MKFEYVPYHESVSDEELLSDLKRVFEFCNTGNLTARQYSAFGRFHSSTIERRFGTWNDSLEKANIPLTQQYWKEEDLYENIENVWIKKGRQPRLQDMNDKSFSSISSGAYLRKFGRWSDALKAFVEFINTENCVNDTPIEHDGKTNNVHQTKRDVNLRLRFRVFQRDNFKCCACGASPATDPSVQLHVDHVIPWSMGGETVMDNLQTLCSKCNIGKGNTMKLVNNEQ